MLRRRILRTNKKDSYSKTLSGKRLQCQLPENIDKDINERKLYETLKNRYEEK